MRNLVNELLKGVAVIGIATVVIGSFGYVETRAARTNASRCHILFRLAHTASDSLKVLNANGQCFKVLKDSL